MCVCANDCLNTSVCKIDMKAYLTDELLSDIVRMRLSGRDCECENEFMYNVWMFNVWGMSVRTIARFDMNG